MNLKKQFAVTLASVGLGAALIGGGTFAYFNDKETVNNTFAAGTLDLTVKPTEVFKVSNLKPGDTMTRKFVISNSGTLNIQDVLMHTGYKVTDKKGDNGAEDFASHLRVNFMTSDGQLILWKDTLKELKAMTDKGQSPDIATYYSKLRGLPVGDKDEILIQIEFVDNGKDQNIFQGDGVELTWTLEAKQGKGEERANN